MAQVFYPTSENADCSAVVTVTPVKQGHRNLESPLEEFAHLSRFANPQIFQCFMTLIPLTCIELPNSQEQLAWR